MKAHANAIITVHKYEPAAYDEPAEGPALCPFTGGFSAVTASVWPVPGAVRLRAGARTALSAMGALPSLGYG